MNCLYLSRLKITETKPYRRVIFEHRFTLWGKRFLCIDMLQDKSPIWSVILSLDIFLYIFCTQIWSYEYFILVLDSIKQKKRPRPAMLFKKSLWHRCFPVNFVKVLRTPFFTGHFRWLLLNDVYSKERVSWITRKVKILKQNWNQENESETVQLLF